MNRGKQYQTETHGKRFGVGVEGNGVEIEEGIKKKKRKSARINTTTKKEMVAPAEGLEPSTTGLKGQRSTKLS